MWDQRSFLGTDIIKARLIRQLLSHTSGYQDYYPQDYVAPFMEKPVTAESITLS
jgi:CubicO group peptidase (beta-lactamase class C family)